MERGYIPNQRTTGRIAETVRRTLGSLPRVPQIKRRVFDDPNTAGGSLILFELVTVDCDAGTATGAPILTSCEGTLPEGDQDITDDLGCFLTGAEALLIGMRCWCQYSSGVYGCTYSIVSMCCADATC